MEISTVSPFETTLIKANFESVFRLRCENVIQEQMARGFTKDVAEKSLERRHCKIPAKAPIYRIDNIQFDRCPCNYKHPLFEFFLQATSAFDKGILPCEGSLTEQPAYIMDVITLIQSLKMDYQIEQQKKAQKEKQ